jgi:hypothetical protein
MSRCSVCDHERREAIERHLAEGTSLRVVAKATGISKDALYRHQKNHNVRELSDAVADRIASGAADGDQGLGDLISSLQLAFEVALQKGDLSHVATLSRELRAAYVEMGKDAARRELLEFGRGGGPVELHVVFDDPEMTDEEAGVLARVLARFGLDGSDPDAIAKLDVATSRLEGAIEHPALPEPTTAHHVAREDRH